jgi:hypothetical protein
VVYELDDFAPALLLGFVVEAAPAGLGAANHLGHDQAGVAEGLAAEVDQVVAR